MLRPLDVGSFVVSEWPYLRNEYFRGRMGFMCFFNGGCMDLLNVSRVELEDGVEYSGVCRVTVGEMKRRISDFVRMVDCKVDAFNLATKQKISKGEIKLRPWEDGFHPNEYFF